MEANCSKLTEKILDLTLEIVYLLTGEDNIVVKKPSGDGQNSVMVPLHSLLFPGRKNEQKILEVTKKIIELLTGETGNTSSFNICIKEEIKAEEESVMEEWEYLEGHKELYKDVIMASQPALTSPEGSNNGNPPERCPRPRDSTQEDLTIPHHDQSGNLWDYNIVFKEEFVNEDEGYGLDSTQEDFANPHYDQDEEINYIKVEVKEEEEETLVSGDQPSMEEIGANYSKEHNVMVLRTPSSVTQRFHHKHKKSKHNSGTAIPNIRSSSHSADRLPDPSKGSSNNNVHTFEDGETSLLRIYTTEKPLSCFMCKKSFGNRPELVQHYRTHAKLKTFSCDQCGKSFHERSKLLRHHRVHTGEKPYPCSVCGKFFSDKGNCDKHMRVHTGEKPFACPECDKCFAQKVALIIHQGTHISQN